jgi:hypothetical protein
MGRQLQKRKASLPSYLRLRHEREAQQENKYTGSNFVHAQ